MGLLKRMSKLLLLTSGFSSTDAFELWELFHKAEMCYFLDGVLAVFGLIVTGMFIKEKFFEKEPAKPAEEGIYDELQGQDTTGYAPLFRKGRRTRRDDPEAGKKPKRSDRVVEGGADDVYTALKPREGEYRELPKKKERRPRKPEEVYQGLSLVTKDTYDSLKPVAQKPVAQKPVAQKPVAQKPVAPPPKDP